MLSLLNIGPDVSKAMSEQRPVVALESTVIAHGLPRPQNLQTANRLQEVVRETGATPATIAIIDGKLTIGLNDDQINTLANSSGIRKIHFGHRDQHRPCSERRIEARQLFAKRLQI